MKNYVGARSVQHNKVYCRNCLVTQEVLYRYGTEIMPAEAKRGDLRCVSCGVVLYTLKVNKRDVRQRIK